jgi:hypothetical protein
MLSTNRVIWMTISLNSGVVLHHHRPMTNGVAASP